MPLVFYLVPLTAALVYALASITLKRGLPTEGGFLRAFFVNNTIICLIGAPAYLVGSPPADLGLLFWPILQGAIALVAAFAGVLALRLTDVSVATPLVGSKVLWVALFTVLFLGDPVPLAWWLAAVLTVVAVYLLGRPPRHLRAIGDPHLLPGAALALLSAAGFAVTDLIIQDRAAAVGLPWFIGVSFTTAGLLGLVLVPFFRGPIMALGWTKIRWIAIGSALIPLQFFGLAWVLSTWGEATALNILYSSRGLWAVLLVWIAGPLLGNRERDAGPVVLRRRLGGAGLLLVAIALVFQQPPQP